MSLPVRLMAFHPRAQLAHEGALVDALRSDVGEYLWMSALFARLLNAGWNRILTMLEK